MDVRGGCKDEAASAVSTRKVCGAKIARDGS